MKIAVMYDYKNWVVDRMSNVIIKHAPKDVKFTKFSVDIKLDEFLKMSNKADLIYSSYWQPFFRAESSFNDLPVHKILFTVHHLMPVTDLEYDASTPKILNVKHINYYSRNTQEYLCKMGFSGNMYKLNQYVDNERFKDIGPKDLERNLVFGSFGAMKRPRKAYWVLAKVIEQCQDMEYIGTRDLKYKHSRIHAYGAVTDNELMDLFKMINVYVSPSKVEGGPMGVLEAMACGIPVVVTNTGFAGDIVKNGVNGFIIPFDNPTALIGILYWIKDNWEEAKTIGENGRRTARKYSPEKFSEQYIKLFRKIVEINK